MIGIGTLVNAAAVIVGGFLGSLVVPRVPERVRETTMQALGLGVLLIGLQMAWATRDLLMLLVSLAIGTMLGELLQIQDRLQGLAGRLERLVGATGDGFAQAFVRTTLLYCVGAMAITGSLQDGLKGDPATLYAKSVLDGISAIMFGSTMGPGVMLAAVPVLIYQGGLTLAAGWVSQILTPDMIHEIGAVGGVLVLGLGLNLTGATHIRVASLLPAMLLSPLTLALRDIAIGNF